MLSILTTNNYFRVVFLLFLTFGSVLLTNGKVVNQSPDMPEAGKEKKTLEERILDLENMVQKLVAALGPNKQQHQKNENHQGKSEDSRVRRAINVTDQNLSGILNPFLSPNDLGPTSYQPAAVSGCTAGLPGRDGRDGRDGPAGLPGRDGNPGVRGEKGDKGERGESWSGPGNLTASSNGGTTYVRWGRVSCPESAELVYHGITGGSHYRDSGSGANLLCLPNDPEYLDVQGGEQTGRARIYSTEYELFSVNRRMHNHEVPCAVCSVSQRGRMLMIPAKRTCPANWTSEYRGYLMAERADYKRGEYICVDELAEDRPGGSLGNQDGALLHRVEGRCTPGNLPCLPYINGNELTCVVCTI